MIDREGEGMAIIYMFGFEKEMYRYIDHGVISSRHGYMQISHKHSTYICANENANTIYPFTQPAVPKPYRAC